MSRPGAVRRVEGPTTGDTVATAGFGQGDDVVVAGATWRVDGRISEVRPDGRIVVEPSDPPGAPPPDRRGPSLDEFEVRMPTWEDEEPFVARVRESAGVFAGWVDPPDSPEAFRDWLGRHDPALMRRHLAFHRGRLIGVVNLQNIVYGQGQFATLGYLSFSDVEGRGLMRRAVALAVDIAFEELGLHRVEAGIQPANTRSIALVRALGFRYEGLLRRLVKVDGAWRDHELWATDTEDWPGARTLFPIGPDGEAHGAGG